MRRLSRTNLALRLTLLAILLPVTARTQQTSPKQAELSTTISSLDRDFFEAYNKCELSKIEAMFTSDIEFYHEKRGEHRFYLTQAGQKEKLDGIGRFANLWQLKDGEWRMSRVFSYGFRSP